MKGIMGSRYLVLVISMSVFLWGISCFSYAQSTLEYTALTGAVTAAEGAATKKDKNVSADSEAEMGAAASKVYRGSADFMSKRSSLSGQVGGGIRKEYANAAEEPEGVSSPKEMMQTVLKKAISATGETPPEEKFSKPETGGVAKLYLKSGGMVEGRILQRSKSWVQIDVDGVAVTYFSDEINQLEETIP